LLLFPCMIAGTVLNQQAWSMTLSHAGQAIFWGCVACAVVVIASVLKMPRLGLFLGAALVAARILRIIAPGAWWPLFAYTVVLSGTFLLAGLALVLYQRRMIRGQVMALVLLSLPLMFLQTSGADPIFQSLRTDAHSANGYTQHATLFVDSDNVVITTLQARPAGFVHANNFLSVILLSGLLLQLSGSRVSYLTVADLGLTCAMVLSFAKIVWLGFAMLILWMMVRCGARGRRKAIKLVALASILLLAYAIIWPGLFAYNASPHSAYVNFQLRLADLVASIQGERLAGVLIPDLDGKMAWHPLGGAESGYARIAPALPALGVAVLLLSPFYVRSLRRLKGARGTRDLAEAGLIVLFVMPIMAQFIDSPSFWFVLGPAAIPLFLAWAGPRDARTPLT